jgi:hypothetical protein
MSRRVLLERGMKISVGGLLVYAAGSQDAWAADKLCADLGKMDSGARALRVSLNYTEASPDAAKTCSVCAFFQGTADVCGSCTIFDGPANAKGRCDSWGPKG